MQRYSWTVYTHHVRSEGRAVKKAVYIAAGTDTEGYKDVLGLWAGENESAKFRLNIMNEMKNRGEEDILMACADGLSGFDNAAEVRLQRRRTSGKTGTRNIRS